MSYYECKRCKYITKLKSDMKRHLIRTVKCGIIDTPNEYTDKDNSELSLIKITNEKNKDLTCDICNKGFSRIDSLNRHKKSYCKKIDGMLNTINVQNNVEKQVNINIEKQVNNYFILDKKEFNMNSFEDNWNIEHFDNYIKLLILLSKTKFTDFLSEVLKNKENLNVILEKDNENGLIYKNDSEMYVKLQKNDILNKSMHKIYEHLQKIHDEYLNKELNNNQNMEQHFLDSIKIAEQTINNKYEAYINNNNIKEQVDSCLLNIYNNKSDDALEIANNINNIKNLGY